MDFYFYFFGSHHLWETTRTRRRGGQGGGALALGERVGTFHLRIKLTPPPNKKIWHKKEKNKTKRPLK
jgi:hypothetical protein